MIKNIKHLNKEINTKHFTEISDNKYIELKNEYYAKPNKNIVQKELLQVYTNNRVSIPNITNYYFKDLMSKVKMHHSKWSIEEMWQSKELVASLFARTQHNKKVFPDKLSDINKFETALRLGGKGLCAKPSNFPLKYAKYVLERYNKNNVYYDMSCGWGVRMLASMSLDIGYLGTDPNHLLVERLNELKSDFDKVNNIKSNVKIRCQGSEIFVPEWENRVGVAFTSPPYFNLEDYRVGNQSCNEDTNYSDWLSCFLKPTIENVFKYLIKDGVMAININNFNDFNLVEDTHKIASEAGFEYVETLTLKNIQRPNSVSGFNDNSEGIIVFKKTDKNE